MSDSQITNGLAVTTSRRPRALNQAHGRQYR
jgi:hypothetical protein